MVKRLPVKVYGVAAANRVTGPACTTISAADFMFLPRTRRSCRSATIDLGLGAVAEGVETEAQRHVLSTFHHCNSMQGYLFAKPLPQPGFAALLTASLDDSRDAA